MDISKKIALFFLLVFNLNSGCICYSQNKVIDSLNFSLKNARYDTLKMELLNDLSWQHLIIGNSDSAIDLANRALLIANSLPMPAQLKGSAQSFANLAMGNADNGNFSASLTYFFKALKIGEDLGNKGIIASNLGNIGNVYGSMGEYDKSLEYTTKAMKISEELGDKKRVATDLGNMGNLYDLKNDTKKALEYYHRSLEMNKELHDKIGIGSNLGNIGLVYNHIGEKGKAITYYLQALIIATEIGDQQLIAITNGSIGELYTSMIEKAASKEKRELAIKAESHLFKALAIDTTIGYIHHLENTYHNLSELYTITENHKRSLEYFKLYSNTKDSLFNEEKNKEITRHEMTYEFEKKAANLKAEQEKKEAVAEADRKRQNIFFWLMSIVAVAIAIIAMIVFRSLRVTRQQKQIIEHQKELVEEKQLEILDSIHYAKRIQESLLPTEKYIDKNINRLRKK